MKLQLRTSEERADPIPQKLRNLKCLVTNTVWSRGRRIDSVCSMMVDAGHHTSVKTYSTHSTEWTLATDNTQHSALDSNKGTRGRMDFPAHFFCKPKAALKIVFIV